MADGRCDECWLYLEISPFWALIVEICVCMIIFGTMGSEKQKLGFLKLKQMMSSPDHGHDI